jgi:hypothetical protein
VSGYAPSLVGLRSRLIAEDCSYLRPTFSARPDRPDAALRTGCWRFASRGGSFGPSRRDR